MGDCSTVRLTTTSGNILYAHRVVITCSPHVLKRPELLKFTPPLPQAKLDALECVNMHTAVKVILKFRVKPWPEHLQGLVMAGCLIPEVWFKDVPTSSGDTAHIAVVIQKSFCIGV